MTSESCHYDCGEDRTHLNLPPYPDVSGLGVGIAYSISAALAICLVLFSYVFTYCLTALPRPENSASSQSGPQSNLIDKALLSWRLHSGPEQAHTNSLHATHQNRVQGALIKCMLVMSDFQLLTGISILISGFTQLPCGISAYHWQKIVYLAWLSSITHLCCLTFLREYFYQHKALLVWRVPGMIMLVVMLLVAMIPTGQYTWTAGVTSDSTFKANEPVPNPQSYAICFFYVAVDRSFHFEDDPDMLGWKAWILKGSRQRMVISAGLLGFGMLQRLCRLHPAPDRAYYQARKLMGRPVRAVLMLLYRHVKCDTWISYANLVFVYRPLLALNLSLQYFLDLLISMAFEILWLIVSFVWCTTWLWLPDRYERSASESGAFEWTYGQVMAILILLPPLISLAEGYMTDSSHSPKGEAASAQADRLVNVSSNSSNISVALPSHSPPPYSIGQHPDCDFYLSYSSFPPLMYAALANITIVTFAIIPVECQGSWEPLRLFKIIPKLPYYYTIQWMLAQFITSTLVSLAFEQGPQRRHWKQFAQQGTLFVLYLTQIQGPFWYERLNGVPKMSFRESLRGYPDKITESYLGTLFSVNFVWMMSLNLIIYVVSSVYGIWRKSRRVT
ncbi:Nn.00g101170.m01.CDS01 [Neocucurbitaria sp. VM-36]